MKLNSIQCEAVEVRTPTGVCVGMAKTRKGETTVIDARTPESQGMCSNAFCAISNNAFIMMTTDSMPGEKEGSIERVCPHGVVTFRLTRKKDIQDALEELK